MEQYLRGGSSDTRVFWRSRVAGLVAWVVGCCTGLRRWAFCGTTRRSGALVGKRVVNVIKGFKEFKERMVLGMRGVYHAGMSLAGGKRDGFHRLGSRRLHALLSGGMWRADAPESIPTLRRGQLVGNRVVNAIIKGFKELKEGKMGVALVGVVMAVVCVGCRERGLVDYALEEAGDNRGEIEGVLARYAEADDGRRELAEYLVGNMPGLYGVSGPGIDSIERFYRSVEMDMDLGYPDSLVRGMRGLASLGQMRSPDLQTAGREYLAGAIEAAAEMRQRRPWNRGLTTEEMAEYLMAYRSGDERLTEWRDAYRGWLSDLEDTLSRTEGSVEAARIVAERIGAVPYNDQVTAPHRTAIDLLEMPVGYCRDDCDRTVYAMRALGIPVAVDVMPVSPDVVTSHRWTVVLDTRDRRMRMFDNNTYLPTRDSIHDDQRKKGKVYRLTLGIQVGRMKRMSRAKNAPGWMRNPRLKDVTAEYFGENETEVRVTGEGDVYAGLFAGGGRYAAIDIAERRGDVAVFRNLEPGVIYFPVTAEGEALGEAFMAGSETIERAREEMERVRLTRKYPVRFYQKRRLAKMAGVKIEAGPTARGPWREVHTVAAPLTGNFHRIAWPAGVKGEYLRITDTRDNKPHIGGVRAYADAEWRDELKVRALEAEKEALTDGNMLTFYPYRDGERGIILKTEGQAHGLALIPRNDDNYVTPGDEYELLWYGGGRWHTAGKKVAEDYAVEFEAPKGAVLWLRDLTKGREEQVFVWRDGRQKFNVDL